MVKSYYTTYKLHTCSIYKDVQQVSEVKGGFSGGFCGTLTHQYLLPAGDLEVNVEAQVLV